MILNKSDRKLAILIDPDKWNSTDQMADLVNKLKLSKVDLILVGGSLITNDLFDKTISFIKANLELPVIIFPGNGLQISDKADGILLLSLISGRNPEFLIGQHVLAAPKLKKSELTIIPTGYMLIDGGNVTSAAYMSNTQPIPYEKDGIASCTALAGEQLGLQSIYLDGGSGAQKSVSTSMIKAVSKTVEIPVIVGGGIKTISEAQEKWDAGANLVVIGTAVEKNLEALTQFSIKTDQL